MKISKQSRLKKKLKKVSRYALREQMKRCKITRDGKIEVDLSRDISAVISLKLRKGITLISVDNLPKTQQRLVVGLANASLTDAQLIGLYLDMSKYTKGGFILPQEMLSREQLEEAIDSVGDYLNVLERAYNEIYNS